MRFIKEYANYKRRLLKEIPHITDNWNLIEQKKSEIKRVEYAIDKGLITVDEAMRTLSNI